MKFLAEIEIDLDILNILIDYANGHTLDSQYFIHNGLEDVELRSGEYIVGGFYSYYPLSPTPLGEFILTRYLNRVSDYL